MFKKILIANRGEVAVRILKTCQKMKIETVVVYSDVDSQSLAVKEGTESFYLGKSESSESYLKGKKLIEIAKQSGAEAIHPGFGFLSENASFAKETVQSGLCFIGPSHNVIEKMGDKILSRHLAKKAGVSVVPGSDAAISSFALAGKTAKRIGFPVMIKASAGGGGKGMSIVWNSAELEEKIRTTKSEALTAFGKEHVFIEKYIENPRHIEIQILADQKGNIRHLGERECSIQRRHQKILEETPAPGFDKEIRREMIHQAMALVQSVQYDNIGTVEFILDKNQKFYFLEMNTRLQVEHAITEMTTGLDLVEQMIRSSAGETLSFEQKALQHAGCALEARIYAEDPARQFVPSIGYLRHYKEPKSPLSKETQIRIDSGIEAGDQISRYYDPMISKVITHGKTRKEAIEELQQVLRHYEIIGVETNLAFLSSILKTKAFQKGELSTDFIEKHYPQGFQYRPLSKQEQVFMVCILAYMQKVFYLRHLEERLLKKEQIKFQTWVVLTEEAEVEISISILQEGIAEARFCQDKKEYSLKTDWHPGKQYFMANVMSRDDTVGKNKKVFYKKEGMYLHLHTEDIRLKAQCFLPEEAKLFRLLPKQQSKEDRRQVFSPMPGLVLRIFVVEEQKVKAGDPLLVIEAMKMENVIKAEISGQIKSLQIKCGDSVDTDQLLIVFF